MINCGKVDGGYGDWPNPCESWRIPEQTTVYSSKSLFWISLTKHAEPHPQRCAYPAVKGSAAQTRDKESLRATVVDGSSRYERARVWSVQRTETERETTDRAFTQNDACGSSTSPRSRLYEIVS